ncbi:hypothetical protein BJ170DRAFT_590259 [Xylariales sp. AK1849]|nr:hypothetical protein BJ170DRAFT_590259 [Xylariales sp. AK1849]
MSAANASGLPEDPSKVSELKGKGKANATEDPIDESMDDDSDDDDEGDDAEAVDEDNLEEIDASNIINGPRDKPETNWAEAAKNIPEDEDDEDDDDFQPADDDDDDRMDED